MTYAKQIFLLNRQFLIGGDAVNNNATIEIENLYSISNRNQDLGSEAIQVGSR